jgi:ACR3 family arsenite transporter
MEIGVHSMSSTNSSEECATGEKGLSTFERYLVVWVALCMVLGILISQAFPWISPVIDSLSFAGISIPIGIALFLMMYPALLNLDFGEMKKLRNRPWPIILTLISNWLIAPFIAASLANIFLQGYPQLIVAVILLGSSPCTAMVLVWGYLCQGNQEQNFIITSINTITILILYAPLVAFYTALQAIIIDYTLLFLSVVLFIGAPLIAGITSKRYLIQKKGTEWFHEVYRPRVGKIAILALLATLIILFSLNGLVLLQNPFLLVLVSIPLLLGFALVVGYNLITTRVFGLEYRQAIITVIIGSSSHFEIAIATAVSLYGVGSTAALGTTMGLFWEVPIMLGLVYLGKALNRRKFWKTK